MERMSWLVQVQDSAFSSEEALSLCHNIVGDFKDDEERKNYDQQRLSHTINAMLNMLMSSSSVACRTTRLLCLFVLKTLKYYK